MPAHICICHVTSVTGVTNRCVEVWNEMHPETDQVSLSSVLAVNVLWGPKVPEIPRAPEPTGFGAPTPPASEATPAGGHHTEVDAVAADVAALTLRVGQVEEAAGIAQTPEARYTLRLAAMCNHLADRLDKAEKMLRKQANKRSQK